MASEHAWAAERQRFIAETANPEENNETASPTSASVQQPSAHGQHSVLGEQFVQLARELFAAESTEAMLERIVAAANQLVPGAEVVSLTLLHQHEQFTTPVHTDELAARLDTLQYIHREGPCVSATLDGGTGQAACQDLSRDRQWPVWSPAAVDEGAGSVLAVGLFPDGAPPRLGSINCYSTRAHRVGQGPDERNTLLLLAAHAATVLSSRRALEGAEREVAGLRQALRTRDVIGQAKGMLMARHGLDAGEAFDRLRQASQSLNRKLADVAVDLTRYPDRLL